MFASLCPCPEKLTIGSSSELMCYVQIRDLNLPIVLCEPVTDMQRRGDFLEYVELLHEVSPPHTPASEHLTHQPETRPHRHMLVELDRARYS